MALNLKIARYMRKVILAVVSVLAVAACGASSSSSSTGTSGSSTTGTGASSPGQSSTGGGGSKVDCAKAKADFAVIAYPGIQVFVGVRDQSSIDDIRNKQGAAGGSFDLNAIIAAVADLHMLDHYSSPGLGDPKAALDDIAAAAASVKAMVDGPATVPQATIDSFRARYTVDKLIVKDQLAISGAYQAAGCK